MRFTTIEPLPFGRICFLLFQANPTKLKGMGGHTFGSSCIISLVQVAYTDFLHLQSEATNLPFSQMPQSEATVSGLLNAGKFSTYIHCFFLNNSSLGT